MSNPVDPWVVQEAKSFTPLPVGFYVGPFKGVEDVTLNGESKWRFSWEVGSGEYKGKAATALTDRTIRTTSLPGQIIAGLLGRALVPGENVKAAIDACIDKPYMVSIQAGPKGGKPQVRTVGKPPSM